MSNADVIREGFGSEGERRGWTLDQTADFIAESSTPDLVYEEDPRWPGAGTVRGRDAVIARWREYREILGEIETEVGAIEEHGQRVLLSFRVTGRSSAGVPFDQIWHYVYDFGDDGRVRRWRAFLDLDDARSAAAADG